MDRCRSLTHKAIEPATRRKGRHCPRRTILVLILPLLFGGCAGKQLWYQAGKTQVDYDQNAQECRIIAEEFARQATMSGNAEDPATYQETLQACLAGKGWRLLPTESQTRAESDGASGNEVLTVQNGRSIQTFGAAVILPDKFALLSATKNGAGPAVQENLLFRGPADTFINVVAQRAVVRGSRFEPTPYPVQSPFFLYEGGDIGDGKMKRPWTIFCGKVHKDWVMGVGSYLLISKSERITITVTRALIAQQTEPTAGFQLSPEQFAVVEAFKKEWLPWLRDKVEEPKSSRYARLLHFW